MIEIDDAIRILKKIHCTSKCIDTCMHGKNRCVYQMAIDALEKQIETKSRDVSDDGIERYVCSCGNLMHKKQKYCDECGQRLIQRKGEITIEQ